MKSADASIKSATVPRPKVYIDADVLLAASVSTRGASHVIVKLSELTLIEGVISEAVQMEVERNLRTKLPAALPAYRALVESAKLRIVPLPSAEQLQGYQGQANEEDLPHLVAACLAGCQYLVTHNTRDYFPQSGLLEVLKPGAFLERVRAQLARLIP